MIALDGCQFAIHVCAACRQIDGEARSLAFSAFYKNVATHQPAKIAAERQAKSGTSEFCSDRGIGLREIGKQVLLSLGRYAKSVVLDLYVDTVLTIGTRYAIGYQPYFAVLGKLGGIGQQVVDRLAQLGAIKINLAKIVATFHDEAIGVLRRKRTAGGFDLVDKRRKVDCLGIQFGLAGLDLRDVENVIDHGQQMLACGADLLEVGNLFAAAFQFRVLEKDFAVAQYRIERRAQFMAHLGEEVRLGAVGLLGFFLGCGQLCQGFLVAGNLTQEFRLGINDGGVITRHEKYICRCAEGRQHRHLRHVFKRNVLREGPAIHHHRSENQKTQHYLEEDGYTLPEP